MRGRILVVALAALTAACGSRYCGGLKGRSPAGLPIIKEAGGRTLYVLERGEYKGYYDTLGQLVRIEHDRNKDGRADSIARYDGQPTPEVLEVDEDADGWVDRFEHYDPTGRLTKIGRCRHRPGREDVWTYLGPNNKPLRVEYDDDGDGRPDRADVYEGDRVSRVEVDADRDGRMDRFQTFARGRIASEELDTDGDGRPDRRLRYSGGRVVGVEPIKP